MGATARKMVKSGAKDIEKHGDHQTQRRITHTHTHRMFNSLI
jgi:hypothetical protein